MGKFVSSSEKEVTFYTLGNLNVEGAQSICLAELLSSGTVDLWGG